MVSPWWTLLLSWFCLLVYRYSFVACWASRWLFWLICHVINGSLFLRCHHRSFTLLVLCFVDIFMLFEAHVAVFVAENVGTASTASDLYILQVRKASARLRWVLNSSIHMRNPLFCLPKANTFSLLPLTAVFICSW